VNQSEWGWVIFGLYALLCIPFAWGCSITLPRQFQKKPLSNMLLFYTLSSTIPIMGLLISLAFLLTLRTLPKRVREATTFHSIQLPGYQQAPSHRLVSFGEASGVAVLKETGVSKSNREKMLVAINRFHNSSVNRLNKQLLKDKSDDIRLYAQGLIEHQERELFKLIQKLNGLFDETSNATTRAFFSKHIAQLLWEQVYKGLVDEDSLAEMLDRIKTYTKTSLETLSDDPGLPLLLVLVCLRQGRLTEAREALLTAKQNHASYFRIALFEAEIAFKEKRFSKIQPLLSTLNNKRVIGAEPVICFWSQP
jgi:hypothetical protein